MPPPPVLRYVSQGVGYPGLHERLLRRPRENMLRVQTDLVLVLVLIRQEHNDGLREFIMSRIVERTFLEHRITQAIQLYAGNVSKTIARYEVHFFMYRILAGPILYLFKTLANPIYRNTSTLSFVIGQSSHLRG